MKFYERNLLSITNNNITTNEGYKTIYKTIFRFLYYEELYYKIHSLILVNYQYLYLQKKRYIQIHYE